MVTSMPTEAFLGVDWGGSEHQLCAVDDTGEVLIRRRVGHTTDGLAVLDDTLAELSVLRVRVAIERGEGLLVEHLQAAGITVYCVSPKLSSRARERYRLADTKSDAFDAFVLADTLRQQHDQWRPLAARSEQTALVASLSRDRERITLMQRAVESRLRATLEAYHPAPLHLFSSLDRDIALAFIRDYPNPVAASRMTVDRMARFCRRHHYSGRVDPAVLLARMQPHLLAASPGTTAGKQIMALHLVDQLEMLNQQERDFNVHLAAAVAAHPDGALFTSFPGIASVIAGVMIGELGDDRARFPAPGALLAESGLAPVTRASGRTRQVRFRYAANKHLRHGDCCTDR